MRDDKLLSGSTPEVDSLPTSSTNDDVHRHWQGVVKRRSFLSGLGMTAAALSAGALLPTESRAEARSSRGRLSPGDVALLQFALWAELVERDLWTQYAELGGVGPSGGGRAQADEEFQGFIGGNPRTPWHSRTLTGICPSTSPTIPTMKSVMQPF